MKTSYTIEEAKTSNNIYVRKEYMIYLIMSQSTATGNTHDRPRCYCTDKQKAQEYCDKLNSKPNGSYRSVQGLLSIEEYEEYQTEVLGK